MFGATLRIAFLLATLVHSGQIHAENSSYVIVVNHENELVTISKRDLAGLFLGKRTMWESNIKVLPVLYEQDNQVTRDFLEQVLRKSELQYRRYWKRRLFSGAGVPPKNFRGTNQILKYVSENPGAIGLVKGDISSAQVRVVARSD